MPPKGERRKQQIIDTAKEMFMEKGFQSTHIGQICEKLEIARGTVYQYFSNKKEILYAILDSVNENVEDILDQDDLNAFLDKNPEKNSIKEFVSNRIANVISVMMDEPIVIKLIFKEIAGIDSEVTKNVNVAIESVRNNVAREVEEIKARGIFKEVIDSKITSTLLIGGVMLVVYEYGKRNLNILDDTVIGAIADNYLDSSFK